jgi:hypothetical protein
VLFSKYHIKLLTTDAMGFMLVGNPAVISGHNDKIARE